MYLDFYRLADEPFRVTPDPEFLFLTDQYREALAAIVYGITARKGFVAITGEVGVGKTTILRSYLDTADRKGMRFVYIFTPSVSFDELLGVILRELGLPVRSGETVSEKVQRLHEELIRAYKAGETVVLFVDEAHNMPVATLESLRMLSNLETATGKLIQIILVGQPELEELLLRHELRQLNSRIAVRTRIGNMSRDDSLAYMRHRLARVQLDDEPVFTDRAMAALVDKAGGIPRAINVLADNALITGFGYKERPVDIRVVREVIADLSGPRPAAKATQPRRWALAAAVPLVLAAIGFAVWHWPKTDISPPAAVAEGRLQASPTIAPPPPAKPVEVPVAAAPPPEPAPSPAPGAAPQPAPQAVPAAPVATIDPLPVAAPVVKPRTLLDQWIDAATTIAFPGGSGQPAEAGRVMVRHGDTLTGLVRASYGVADAATLHWVLVNNPEVTDPDVLYVGQVLRFPALPTNVLEAKTP